MGAGDHLNMPGREFVLSPDDLGSYSDLLVAAFPGVRFYESYRYRQEGPPDLPIHRSLHDFEGRNTEIVFSAADWVPEWEQNPSTGNWVLANEPGFTGRIDRGGRVQTKVVDGHGRTMTYLSAGRVYFRCRKWAPEEMKAARTALRLLTKVATNQVASTRWPSGLQPHGIITGDNVWCGHDALRWVREHPDRRLGCWRAPDDEWRGYRPLGA